MQWSRLWEPSKQRSRASRTQSLVRPDSGGCGHNSCSPEFPISVSLDTIFVRPVFLQYDTPKSARISYCPQNTLCQCLSPELYRRAKVNWVKWHELVKACPSPGNPFGLFPHHYLVGLRTNTQYLHELKISSPAPQPQ